MSETWNCFSCGARNVATVEACFICGKKRVLPSSSDPAPAPDAPAAREEVAALRRSIERVAGWLAIVRFNDPAIDATRAAFVKDLAGDSTPRVTETERDARRWQFARTILHVVSTGPSGGYYLTSDIADGMDVQATWPDAFVDQFAESRARVPVEGTRDE